MLFANKNMKYENICSIFFLTMLKFLKLFEYFHALNNTRNFEISCVSTIIYKLKKF